MFQLAFKRKRGVFHKNPPIQKCNYRKKKQMFKDGGLQVQKVGMVGNIEERWQTWS
jgi:hypothetical protein